jgi:large subunit ribosomal protein L9
MPVQVILHENMDNLGIAGDIVRVKDGYARNYLIPNGLAALASSRNISELEHQKRSAQAKRDKLKLEAEKIGKSLEAAKIVLPRQVGEEDKLFGSVTSMDIEAALRAQGHNVSKKQIHLPEPIKTLGLHEVGVKIHPEITIKVRVNVTKIEEPAKEATARESKEHGKEHSKEAKPKDSKGHPKKA